jgi:hypothetical protein
MARKFRKRSDLHVVILPGVGRMSEGQILTGDDYARFVPHLLEEVLAAGAVPMAAVDPGGLTEPAPAPKKEEPQTSEPEPAPADLEESEESEESEEDYESAEKTPAETAASAWLGVEPRKRGRPKKG